MRLSQPLVARHVGDLLQIDRPCLFRVVAIFVVLPIPSHYTRFQCIRIDEHIKKILPTKLLINSNYIIVTPQLVRMIAAHIVLADHISPCGMFALIGFDADGMAGRFQIAQCLANVRTQFRQNTN